VSVLMLQLSGIQIASFLRRIILPSVVYQIISRYLINGTIFGRKKKLIKAKFFFSL